MKASFEERLVALQSKMEEQFVDQLKKIEDKIKNQAEISSSQSSPEKANNSVSELSSKVIQLQSDIGTKDLQILSLKRDIASLEAKLVIETPKVKEKVNTLDAMIGDGDVTTDTWVSSDEAMHLKDEIRTQVENLRNLQKEISDTQAKLSSLETQLDSSKNQNERAESRIALIEASLQKEKDAKNEIMNLFEQTKRGIQVDVELAKSMSEQRERDTEQLRSLQKELKELEHNSTTKLAVLSKNIETEKNKFIEEHEKVIDLTEELDTMKEKYESEMKKLVTSHSLETEAIQNSLKNSHQAEKNSLETQLQEERLLKIEKEVERNDAVHAKDLAERKRDEAESRLKKMTDLVKEAKVLVGVNERLHRRLQVETDRRKTLHNKLEDLKGRIRVYVRIRPMSSNERSRSCQESLKKEDKRTCVLSKQDDRGVDTKSWEFDQVFCGTSPQGNSQEDVFKDTRNLVTSAVDGFNVCIFAYGQTGSGKTFTMFGSEASPENNDIGVQLDENSGLAPRVAVELFRVLEEKEASSHVGVTVNMFELYNDGLRDLLLSKENDVEPQLKIKLAEHSDSGLVEVEGASSESVNASNELVSLFKRGTECRTTATTQMNADSSRSHLITSMVTKLVNKRTGRTVCGKLTLVDLAGSERVSKR